MCNALHQHPSKPQGASHSTARRVHLACGCGEHGTTGSGSRLNGWAGPRLVGLVQPCQVPNDVIWRSNMYFFDVCMRWRGLLVEPKRCVSLTLCAGALAAVTVAACVAAGHLQRAHMTDGGGRQNAGVLGFGLRNSCGGLWVVYVRPVADRDVRCVIGTLSSSTQTRCGRRRLHYNDNAPRR
eukprot:scaffold3514_cov132-Isochrysis_galbana.AAC.4